jgi:hypothetical protein
VLTLGPDEVGNDRLAAVTLDGVTELPLPMTGSRWLP